MTLEAIKQAIQDYFGDTSRPASETREGLLDIASHAEQLAEAIAEDAE